MKRTFYIGSLLLLMIAVFPFKVNSQEDAVVMNCLGQLKAPFVVTGQPLKAFLTGDEVAEFHTTFFEGNVYRIVACSQQSENVIFSVYDKDHNLIFSNDDLANTNFWDFKMEGSVECIVEAKLNSKKTSSGMAMLMIGFKNVSN
jgi:hypothetical protein